MPEPQFQLTLTHLPPDIPSTLLGQTVRLKHLPTTIGRGRDAGITIKHRSLSRLHCRFYLTDGRLAVKDLASTNGTLINGYRINEDSFLQVGDHITFGSIVFQLSLLNASVPAREPESVPESAVPDSSTPDVNTIAATASGAAQNVAAGETTQPATDQLRPFDQAIGNPTPATPQHDVGDPNDVPLDLIQSAAMLATPTNDFSSDAVDFSGEQVSLLDDIDAEQDLAALIDDRDSDLGDQQDFSPASLDSVRPSGVSKAPSGFKVDDSVVFFESNPNAPIVEESDSSMASPDEVQQAGEREMSVESAAERENVADLMRRHQLGQPESQAESKMETITLDTQESSLTPIIPDRHEDRLSQQSKAEKGDNVLDLDLPNSAPGVSSVNIETSFVAGSSNVDLGDFMKDRLTGKPNADELVIEEPSGDGPSMTALGEFFKRKNG